MHSVLIFVAAAVALFATDKTAAQPTFFNKRYCLQSSSSRVPDCSYNTWEQCRASASGLSRYCAENPNWKPEGAGGNARAPRRKQGRE